MLHSVTKRCDDLSTDRCFCFVFYCDICGAEWKSEQYLFSMRDNLAASEGEKEARVILWKAEHDCAYERANIEAIFNFNKCHGCGKRVCDDCFCELQAYCLSCESGMK